ncbi:unnamed protein product [Orchesella dallaii]|uniref:Uncharacterized protein n=1 Tax=Orchesella dallaii TaxID=48710 RepID=A0ABP1Q4H4_9HEXA
MVSINMNSRNVKKILALLIALYVIPQAIYLVMKLAWVIFITFISFLIVDIGVTVLLKTWCPDNVSTITTLEWLLHTSLGFCSTFLNVFRYLVHSVFDLVYGKVFQQPKESSTSTATRRASRNNNEENRGERVIVRSRYMTSSIRAMTKSAGSQTKNIKHTTF